MRPSFKDNDKTRYKIMAKEIKEKKVCKPATLATFKEGEELLITGDSALAQNIRTCAINTYGTGVFSVNVQKGQGTILIKKLTDALPLRQIAAHGTRKMKR